MSLNSLRLATILVIVYLVSGYFYPEGMISWYFITLVFGFYLIVLFEYEADQAETKQKRPRFENDNDSDGF